MRYECNLCGEPNARRKEARLHARQAHGLKLGWSKGGDLEIAAIPTYYGETATAKPKTTSWLDFLFKKREERKAAGQYVAPIKGEVNG